ncbi:MAG: type I glyceraldehyde-3-phosphate dehydrogenase [Acidobacteria bacterium]|nr:MAG: type I glyceraldehyde-3-phosphate dehydrogenase [Acidobacteriota bacterium]
MTVRIGINGFGRMGRLGLRAAFERGLSSVFEIAHINEAHADAEGSAHLLKFDSLHGQWTRDVRGERDSLLIDGKRIAYSQQEELDVSFLKSLNLDIVLDCTGVHRKPELLQPYFEAGIEKVVVSAPIKGGGLNVVVGVNDDLYQSDRHHMVSPASCTTNCVAPVIKVLHEQIGLKRGTFTTIHDVTNTQVVIDTGHTDLRRARANSLSLIPTSTNSAKAIVQIFPDLVGKLFSIAVRVPVLNASLCDCVFEMHKNTTREEINRLLKEASEGALKGILGYEDRPLVSVDYLNDTRSGIVDALNTEVIEGNMVKLLVWYDNEIGYVHRMMELVRTVAESM